MAQHRCGRCNRIVDITDIGWIHLLGKSISDNECVRAVPEYLYNPYEEEPMNEEMPISPERYVKVTIIIESDEERNIIRIPRAKDVKFGQNPHKLEAESLRSVHSVYARNVIDLAMGLQAERAEGNDHIYVMEHENIGQMIEPKQ